MTTDRELLELAAKAAGIEFIPERSSDDMLWLVSGGVWSPKHDDGDALRMAVKLRMVVGFDQASVADTVYAYCTDTDKLRCYERAQSDPYAATRRAIVRAAAEIGRNMK